MMEYTKSWIGFDGQLTCSQIQYQQGYTRSIMIPSESDSTVVNIPMNCLLSDDLVVQYTYNLGAHPDSEFKNFLDKKTTILQNELLNFNLARLFLVNGSTNAVGFLPGETMNLSDVFVFDKDTTSATATIDYRFADREERIKQILDFIATDDDKRFVPNAIRRNVPKYPVQQTVVEDGTMCCFNFYPNGLTTFNDYNLWSDGAYIKFADESLVVTKKGTIDYIVVMKTDGPCQESQGYKLDSDSVTFPVGQQNIILHLWS